MKLELYWRILLISIYLNLNEIYYISLLYITQAANERAVILEWFSTNQIQKHREIFQSNPSKLSFQIYVLACWTFHHFHPPRMQSERMVLEVKVPPFLASLSFSFFSLSCILPLFVLCFRQTNL